MARLVSAGIGLGFLLLGIVVSGPSQGCQLLDDPGRTHIVERAREIVGLPLNATVRISGEAMDPSTCWMQLGFDASLPGTTLKRVLFLSPDRRFLTTTVYDTQARSSKPLEIAPTALSGYIRVPQTCPPPPPRNPLEVGF